MLSLNSLLLFNSIEFAFGVEEAIARLCLILRMFKGSGLAPCRSFLFSGLMLEEGIRKVVKLCRSHTR
jgi:hypothetical protein